MMADPRWRNGFPSRWRRGGDAFVPKYRTRMKRTYRNVVERPALSVSGFIAVGVKDYRFVNNGRSVNVQWDNLAQWWMIVTDSGLFIRTFAKHIPAKDMAEWLTKLLTGEVKFYGEPLEDIEPIPFNGEPVESGTEILDGARNYGL